MPRRTTARFAPLAQRLRYIVFGFAALSAIGLVLALIYGDAGSVLRVHRATWTQEHNGLVRVFTEYGLYFFYILFLVLYVWAWYRREAGLKLLVQAYVLAQLLGSVVVVRILKMTLGRARPDVTPLADFGSNWIGFSWQAGHHSFPSGHTADIVTSAVFAALVVRNPWLAAFCVVWAGVLGLSRLALAKHYPSDALVGGMIALAASLLVLRYWLQPRLERAAPGASLHWWRAADKPH